MICIETVNTGERLKIEREIWITRNRNGILRTAHRVKALGVGDGERIWSFGALEGYSQARIIPLAEFLAVRNPAESDPELGAEEALEILLGGNYEAE